MSFWPAIIVGATLLVAYANGANDNFKGVATLFGSGMSQSAAGLHVLIDNQAGCMQRLFGSLFGVNGQRLVNVGHFLSAGAVGFARGLNDTLKLVALAWVGGALDLPWAIALVASVMAFGGLFHAQEVAQTVSKRITAMDPSHGFLANVVTSFLVIFASKWDLPVSTTHVSCGALIGIGVANGQARWNVIRTILMAWLLTLPIAALSAGLIYAVLSALAMS